MPKIIYDAAVLGLGTMGSATVFELARRKASVIGFDQFRPPHGSGSHSGQTRVFRTGYAESPDYVPLVQRASSLWDSLSEEFGTKLVIRNGLLTVGLEASEQLRGISRCVDLFQLPVARLTAEEIRYRYPAFHIPDEFIGLLETEAGWIDVDSAITCMLDGGTKLGARVCFNEEVLGWEHRHSEVVIRTAQREVVARRVVVTAGAWAAKVLGELKLPIHVLRKYFVWVDPVAPEYFGEEEIPIFGFPPNSFYGFPNIGGKGVKIAEHWGGERIARPEEGEAVTRMDETSILATAARFLPGLAGPSPGDPSRILRSATCLYSMTPDEHFLLDSHPLHNNVVFAAGFSGHGFKFAPVIGEVMADLAMYGDTRLPIGFLRREGRGEEWDARSKRMEAGHEGPSFSIPSETTTRKGRSKSSFHL